MGAGLILPSPKTDELVKNGFDPPTAMESRQELTERPAKRTPAIKNAWPVCRKKPVTCAWFLLGSIRPTHWLFGLPRWFHRGLAKLYLNSSR